MFWKLIQLFFGGFFGSSRVGNPNSDFGEFPRASKCDQQQ